MTVLGCAGLAIAGYLLMVRLLGEAPACGPVRGCDTVAASEFATMFGLPVALFGVGFSLVLSVAVEPVVFDSSLIAPVAVVEPATIVGASLVPVMVIVTTPSPIAGGLWLSSGRIV